MSPTPLVEAVCAEIYPVIDEFIKDARIVISFTKITDNATAPQRAREPKL
jgi:hypothetical protein